MNGFAAVTEFLGKALLPGAAFLALLVPIQPTDFAAGRAPTPVQLTIPLQTEFTRYQQRHDVADHIDAGREWQLQDIRPRQQRWVF
ncbi:hypothetical protein D9M68_116100 [compost metagenome]|uniref:Uncharacterized protein n=1 Tax=Pseudomonas jinjuensis TaxID=198616 RepID=A0A1H0L1A4_9PSED|nr:hypothetical protein [Pseudomonas jinjuensis]SDO62007.1 hypothetical protein SAMN05216193_113136 [Pseudomonas jinjuensis]